MIVAVASLFWALVGYLVGWYAKRAALTEQEQAITRYWDYCYAIDASNEVPDGVRPPESSLRLTVDGTTRYFGDWVMAIQRIDP